MERLINQKNISPMTIIQIPQMSFAIGNKFLTLNTKATNFKMSPQATTSTTWNYFENFKDGSLNIKHLERCS
jgi:hypothetical protein